MLTDRFKIATLTNLFDTSTENVFCWWNFSILKYMDFIRMLQLIFLNRNCCSFFHSRSRFINLALMLIRLIEFPVGMYLLYLFLHKSLSTWFFTYITILALYFVIHVIMSYFFQFHSLAPAWKLS